MSLLLRNVRLVGGDPEPVDLLLRHGIVTGIGHELTGSVSRDIDGRFVLPGLWDEHTHLAQTALTSHRADLGAATSAAHAARLMASALSRSVPAPGQPLVGTGFRDGLWPDEPTRALLDAVALERPIVLISGDQHCVWLNTAALSRYGHAGHPTGILREDDAFPVTAAVQGVPTELLDEWIGNTAALAAARGVTGIVDLEMAGTVADWTRRFAAGFGGMRIDAGVYTAQLDAAILAGQHTGQVLDGTGGLLRVGPFKVITDGSLNTRTAFCDDPYDGMGGSASNGILTVPTEQLIALLRVASAAGFVPAVHAIGDGANRLALDAFEAAGCSGRIEHAQLLHEDDIPRFAALGIAASVQPEHAMDDRDVADKFWSGRTDRAFVLRSLVDAGVELLLGSDAPVAPLDPWVTIAAAVGRSRDGRGSWHPEQRVTTAEALRASTRGRGVVRTGDIADLAIVDRDPLTSSHEELRSMPVSATLLAGYYTHDVL